MTNKTALVDVDGVLADFTTAALRGTQLSSENVTQWDFFSQLSVAEAKLVRDRLHYPMFWRSDIRPIETARGFGDRLRVAGYEEVVLITAPWSKQTMAARTEWLVEHYGGQFDALVFDKNKARHRGDLLIDDKPSNLTEWQSANSGLAICYEQPYNAEFTASEFMFRRRLPNWTWLASVLG